MKPQRNTPMGNVMALSAHPLNQWLPAARRLVTAISSLGIFALLLGFASSVGAQIVEFRSTPVRVTVPLNTTNATVIFNIVDVGGLETNPPTPVDFTVTGLPAGAGYSLTESNGAPLLSTLDDTNLYLTIFTTNIAEGLHVFYLNGTGGATNSIPFILQAAHVWNGTPDTANNWSSAASWLTGVPDATSDVVFGNLGSQTNLPGPFSFTNSIVDVNTTIGSLRFAQTVFTNDVDTNSLSHTIQIAPNTTLTVVGTNGFSLLRDQVDEFENGDLVATMDVNFVGGNSSKLVVSNANANFAVMIGRVLRPTLNMSNLQSFTAYVNHFGLAEYELYPFYREYNDQNDFGNNPRQFIANVFLARTNIITGLYVDPDNYTNVYTRSYAVSYEDSQTSGVGSSTTSFLFLGQTNAFLADGVCLVRANTGGGTVRFNPIYTNGIAVFRSPTGGRMSVFTVSDDGGTNQAASNVKATIDFAAGNGFVDILADRLYISRDRTLITSNQTPNVQGDLLIGRGIVDVNTAILGFQEHDGKTNWTAIGSADPYLNYCQGRLTVGNAGLFRVNGTLTLGYTADTNPEAVAQQFNTYGQITITSNGTVAANSIVADGGLNYTSTTPRQNRITINQGTLIVTNTMGAAPGLPLDRLSMTAGTLRMNVVAGATNVFVRELLNFGNIPSIIKVVSVANVTTFPTNIPIISYETATPFLTADMAGVTGLPAGVQGYILNNSANNTIDLFLTTNAPQALVWAGTVNNVWDITTKNWVTAVGGLQTNFTLGDIVTFDDTSSVTNIDIVDVVVPNQAAAAGVTITNATRGYTFNPAGGAIAGTASILKQGAGGLTFNATEAGPIRILEGTLDGSGLLGTTTVASNAVANFSGTISGGLTSTGTVTMVSGSSISGAVTIRGGTFENSGTIATAPGTLTITGGAIVTNTALGVITVSGGNWTLPAGCTLANFGTIINQVGRLNSEGLVFGTGFFVRGPGVTANNGRLAIRPGSTFSPGDAPSGSIGSTIVATRLDLDAVSGVLGTLLIEVDFSSPQTNDVVQCDLWNNFNGYIQMENINPGAGTFQNGQSFLVLSNNAGTDVPNVTDAPTQMAVIAPPLPAPGLHWNLVNLRTNGIIAVTNSLVWRGTVNGDWDTTTGNWLVGTYADDFGVLFDDTATGETNINLTTVLAPASTNRLPTVSPGIIVNNSLKQYTFSGSGSITGAAGIYKSGPGTLTILTTNNTYTGRTIIDGGTLVVSRLANINTFSSIGTPGASGTPGGNAIGAERLTINGGTLRYIGTTTSANRPMMFGENGATLDITGDNTNVLTIAGTLLGTGGLTKIGPASLLLNQGNTYQGTTTISEGTLVLTAGGRASTNTIILADAALQFAGAAAGFTLDNAINVVGTAAQMLVTNPIVSGGVWTGSGTLALTDNSLLSFRTNISGFSGTIALGASTGTLRFNSTTNNGCTGSAAATFDLGSGSATLDNLYGAGATYDLGALLGGPNSFLSGRSTNAGAPPGTTYSIGALGTDTTFSGSIKDGNDTVSITKVGAGKLLLNGNSTATGLIIVSAGTLGGTGVLSGPLLVSAGGTLAPGTSIGTLTVNNALTNAGTISVEISKNGGAVANDRIIGLTTVSYGGTLVVTKSGADDLVQGDSFPLFSASGAKSGNFSSIVAPALPTGLVWNFDPLTGVLSVAGPTLNYDTTTTPGSIVFSWTGQNGATFKLQAQTNSLSVGISTNWGDYPGGGTSPVTVAVDPSQPTVFFRLFNQ